MFVRKTTHSNAAVSVPFLLGVRRLRKISSVSFVVSSCSCCMSKRLNLRISASVTGVPEAIGLDNGMASISESLTSSPLASTSLSTSSSTVDMLSALNPRFFDVSFLLSMSASASAPAAAASSTSTSVLASISAIITARIADTGVPVAADSATKPPRFGVIGTLTLAADDDADAADIVETVLAAV